MSRAEDLAQLKRLWERAQGRDIFLLALRPGMRGSLTNLKPPPGSPADCTQVFRVTAPDMRTYLSLRSAL